MPKKVNQVSSAHHQSKHAEATTQQHCSPHSASSPFVKVLVQVLETKRVLDTMYWPQQTSFARVRADIVEKHKKILMKNMFLTEKQLRGRIAVIMDQNPRSEEYYECEGHTMYKLAHLGMRNGGVYTLTVKFARAFA